MQRKPQRPQGKSKRLTLSPRQWRRRRKKGLGMPKGYFAANVPRVGGLHIDRTKAGIALSSKRAAESYRQYDVQSVEDYPECRTTVFRPLGFSDGDVDHTAPTASLQLEHVYGYSGHTPTVGGSSHGDQNLFLLQSGELIYPASAVVVLYDFTTKKQRFFCGHNDDVTCIAVCPDDALAEEYSVVASGQVASPPSRYVRRSKEASATPIVVYAPIHVWKTAKSPTGELRTMTTLSWHERSIRAMDFSPDGRLLLSVGADNQCSLAVWDWQSGELLATARGHAAPIVTAGFDYHSSTDLNAALRQSDTEYLLTTCGKKHVKFWTLTFGKDMEYFAGGGDGKSTDSARLAEEGEVDDVFSVGMGPGSCADRDGIMQRLRLRGKAGRFGSDIDIEDCICLEWVPFFDLAKGDAACAVVVGTVGGHMLLWRQAREKVTEEDSDSESDTDEEAEASLEADFRKMNPNFSTESCVGSVQDAHQRGTYGLEYIETMDSLLSVGGDGVLKIWSISPGQRRPELQEVYRFNTDLGHQGTAVPRSMVVSTLSEDGMLNIIIGTSRNTIARFALSTEDDVDGTPKIRRIAESKLRDLLHHSGTLFAVAAHPSKKRFATAAEDQIVSVGWKKRQMLRMKGVPGKAQAICYSNDGQLIAVGMSNGTFSVLNEKTLETATPFPPQASTESTTANKVASSKPTRKSRD